jgi:signal transduction histidine kinase/ActR/RegA family two-component response regulator/CHASE3 domain sensor protein
MTSTRNWSIGRRLAAGFGLLLGVLGMLLVAVFAWLADNEAAHSHYVDQVLPRIARADLLDRAVLETGMAARNWLIEPTESRRSQFEQSAAKMRDALSRLGEMTEPGESRARYEKLQPAVERYAGEVSRVATERPAADTQLIDLRAIGALRETARTDLRELLEAEQRAGAEALAQLAANRAAVLRSLWIGGLLAVLSLLVIGYFTAQSIRRPTQALLGVASGLQRGDWKPALGLARRSDEGLSSANEMLQLSDAFGAAALVLEQRERRLRADGAIASAVASTLDLARLAGSVLGAALEHLEAEIGVLYCRDTVSGALVPVAQHACAGRLPALQFGEGIPGGAASERRSVVLRDIPPDTPFKVRLGYDEAPPRAVAAIPVMFREEVLGVLLVASLRPLEEDAIAFLEAAALQLGVGLKNAQAYAEVQRLLAEVSEKSEQIQGQNEELQAQNEEIQAQNEEIQAQSEEIQAQNEELQSQSDALRRQSERLAEADTRKNEFLGVLAHELRNPLAPISNSTVLLRRLQPGSDGFVRAQAVIERQLKHLTRLIDDLLDVTRISRGKIQLRRERLDLVGVLNECVADHWSSLEHNDLALELDLPDTPIWVHADRTRLCQVLGNLITNAVKFTAKSGRIAVSVSLHPDSRQVALHVADNGIGIEGALLRRLFEPFSQGETELARTQGGLGLGLALVKGLVELHGGSVEARSDGAQRGAEFVVRFPLYTEHSGAHPHEAPVLELQPPAEHAPAVPSPRRILIIEDNFDAAHSLRDLLQPEGHQIEVAYSGSEGLAKALVFRPDVVLCDIGLPGLDGYEVARKIRADPRLSSALLVAVTGYATLADQQRAAAAGFDEHIAKPPDPERLIRFFTRLESQSARSAD